MLFSAIVVSFLIGLLIGLGSSRAAPRTGDVLRQSAALPDQTEDYSSCREFTGFPLSPAMRKFNRENDIATELTAEFLRNQNMRQALNIKRERQDLLNQARNC